MASATARAVANVLLKTFERTLLLLTSLQDSQPSAA
jgi:hypothetical protein